MIRTYEELEALPEETPILDVKGFVWESAGDAAYHAEQYGTDTVLPAVRLIPATISQEQFRQAVVEYTRLWNAPPTFVGEAPANLKRALKTLGIEVSDE